MVRRSIWAGLVALCLFCGLKTSTTLAQAVYGSILGTVTDQQGAAVSGAKVTVTSLTKNTAVETTTNESGNYTFPDLPQGLYTVEVENAGFKKERRSAISVEVNSSQRIDMIMQPGNVTESGL